MTSPLTLSLLGVKGSGRQGSAQESVLTTETMDGRSPSSPMEWTDPCGRTATAQVPCLKSLTSSLWLGLLLVVTTLFAEDNTELHQLSEASRYLNSGQSEKARASIHATIEQFKDDYLKAQGLILLGELEGHENNLQKSIDAFRKGANTFNRINDPIGEVIARNSLMVSLFNSGQLDYALEESTKSLEILSELDNSETSSLVSPRAYLQYLQIRDLLPPNLEVTELQFRKKEFITSARAFALTWTGVIDRKQGNYEEAVRALEAALEVDREHGPIEELTLGELADTKLAMGSTKDAVEIYERAFDAAIKKGNREAAMKSLVPVAEYRVTQLEYEKALPLLRKALELSRQLGNHTYELRILLALSNCYDSLGLQKEAVSTAREAMTIADSIDKSMTKDIELYLRLVTNKVDDASARAAASEFLEYATKSGESEGLYLALIIKALTDIEGDVDGLQSILDEALRISREQGSRHEEILTRIVRGIVFFDHNKFEKAEEEWAAVSSIDSDEQEINNLMATAMIDIMKRSRSALSSLGKIADFYEIAMGYINVDQNLSAFIDKNVQSIYDSLVYACFVENEPEAAFEYSEKAKARAFLKIIGNEKIAGNRGNSTGQIKEILDLENAISDLEKRLGEDRDAVREPSPIELDLKRQLHSYRDRYGELLREIKESDLEYASLASVDTIKLSELQGKILDYGSVLLSYYAPPCDSDVPVLVWAVDRNALHLAPIEMTGKELCAQVAHIGNLIRSRDVDLGAAGRLYDRLIAPLEQYIDSSEIIIAPHGVLHFLPFAALWNQRSNRYFVEEHSLVYVPSASAMKYLVNKRSPNEGRALIFAHSGGTLKFAEEEAENTARSFHTQAFLGKDASEKRIHDRLEEVDVLHIAAHGSFDEKNPLFSRLKLEAGGGYDGFLEVHEIFNLDLTGTNLVVLSACDTALGQQTRGDELVGMTRAFLYAGSPAVVTTLWSVDDAAAGALMESFYRHLQTDTSIASALRKAQVETLSNPRWATPYYWAPYILSGDSHWSPPEEESRR